MTIKQFFESKEKLAIHCDTEEQAKRLLKAFDNASYTWRGGEKYIKSYWRQHEETCYDNNHMFGSKQWYQTKGYKILEFEDIFEIDLSQVSTEKLLEEIKKRRIKE